MKKLLVGFVASAASLALVFAFPLTVFAGDGQLKLQNSIEKKLTEQTKIMLEDEMHITGPGLQYHHFDLGVSHRVLDWRGLGITLGVNYREIFENGNHGWTNEHRPHVNAEAKYALYDFNLKLRERLEFRFKENTEMTLRDRVMGTIEFPVVTALKLRPYVSHEIFYDFHTDKLNQHETAAGVKVPLSKNINMNLYYMRQTTLKTEWDGTNIVGFGFNFAF